MCVVSMVGDYYGDRWRDIPIHPTPNTSSFQINYGITKEEFDALKKEVEQMKELLIRAKIYDEEHGEPDCSMDEKVELLKKIADAVGVDLSEVFGNNN